MYDILGKFNKLTPQETTVVETAPSPLYESVEARGSIVAGVKDVEQKLREQFDAMKEERETLKTKSGTIYKGGKYGTEYQGDADDEDAPKRGRPAAGTARKEKVVRVKGPKGRPKKDKPAEYSKSNDPFGRVPDKAPKGKKGTVVKGKATQDTNEAAKNPYAIGMAQAKKETGLGRAKATNLPKSTVKRAHHIGDTIKANESRRAQLTNMLLEGVNFTEMIKKKDITLQEMLAELQSDIQTFKETGHCSELLRDCMEVHSFNKQQLNDAVMDESPVFSMAAHKQKQANNSPPPAGPSMLDRAKQFGGKVLNKLGHGSDEEMKADLRRKMGMTEAEELDELARLAGLSIKESAGFASRELEAKIRARLEQMHDSEEYEPEDVYDTVADEFGMTQLELQDALAADDVAEANDGNLANNAKPYDRVTQGDVVAGRLGKDEMGGKHEVDKGDMEEGNEFSGELAKAKAQHKDSFEVDGKQYPVQEGETCPTCKSEPCACEDTEAADQELAKLKENCGIVSPIGSMAQDMQKEQGKMSINTTQSSDGTKNINISADGEAADQLMQILKMAGMAGAQQHQHAEIVVAAQPMEAKEYGNTDVEQAPEYVNSPREEVEGMHSAETVGFADQTDDLNKQKEQDPATANKAANPKTKQMTKLESANPLEALGAKLMAEYQGIKIAK